MWQRHKFERRAFVGLALGMAATLPACAGSRAANEKAPTQGTSTGIIPELYLNAEVDASVGGLINYNPYSPKPLTSTWLYEPLMVQSSLSCEITPWLATGYTWSGNVLTLDMRPNVTWSDGEPFTAKDVAFTLNLLKKYPALDSAGIWSDGPTGSKATKIEAQDTKVIITFGGPAAQKLNKVIGVKILPEHKYATVGDVSKYVDKEPAGTGPFKVGSYNGRQLILERRPDYWQADKIAVQKLRLSGSPSADQALLLLKSGELDFYSGEIPNPQKAFVDADPSKYGFWCAPNGMTVVIPNLSKKPFSDVKFREAMAYAVDKKDAALKATYGLMGIASQTGLVLPNRTDMLPDGVTPESAVLPHDPAKAAQLLDAAGYRKGSDGLRTKPDGSPMKITFDVQAGWIDYEAAAASVVAALKAVDLDVKLTKSSPDAIWQTELAGTYDLNLGYLNGGCTFGEGLAAALDPSQVPISDTVYANLERFIDPAVADAIHALLGASDPAEVKKQVGVLVNAMMQQYPLIPLFYAPARGIYTTIHATGWPTADNPYANPQDNHLLIMTHLTPPKKS